MAYHRPEGFAAEPGYDAIEGGWFFDHRADGSPIGPFETESEAAEQERQHWLEPVGMPAWAAYQS